MAKKVALADVLWEAANEHLDSGDDDENFNSRFTCDAVRHASGSYNNMNLVLPILYGFGLPSDADARYDLFEHFEKGEQRQGVRYMWLLLAMHVAQDERIQIEVA
jgi:hypothetical protein